jgi:hypothetical protein
VERFAGGKVLVLFANEAACFRNDGREIGLLSRALLDFQPRISSGTLETEASQGKERSP